VWFFEENRVSGVVFITVITAALVHASWNSLVKGSTDKTLAMGAIVIGHVPIAIIILPFATIPDSKSIPYLLTGIMLHFGYQLFLLKSYEHGDLTKVYPIARGTAPLLVGLFSLIVLGVELSNAKILSIIIIGVAVISLAFGQKSDGQKRHSASTFALITGLFIASYSLIDGLGARVAGTSLGFFCLLAIGNGFLMVAYLARKAPKTLKNLPHYGLSYLLIGGTGSFTAYALVIWAFTKAPIALVTALRETSIVFAFFMGVFFLKEPPSLIKLIASTAILMGVVLLHTSK
jgi:drug/metabolite transporter (DMT)-like permease